MLARPLTLIVSFLCEFPPEEVHFRTPVRKPLCDLLQQQIGLSGLSVNDEHAKSQWDASQIGVRNVKGNLSPDIVVGGVGETDDETRDRFWQLAARLSFVLAPPGRGLDTHRVWEALALGAIPVVVHSSLDRLYSDYPVLIVSSWNTVFNLTYLEEARGEIYERFVPKDCAECVGWDTQTEDRLSMDYWIKRVRTFHLV